MTLQLENYGVSELSHSEQNETDGGYSLREFSHDAGYAIGWTIGATVTIAGLVLEKVATVVGVEHPHHK